MQRTLNPLAMLTLLAALASGCAARIAVELPAAPAVHVEGPTVAVVAADRSCNPLARALLDRLSSESGLRPDPAAELRVVLVTCGVDDRPRAKGHPGDRGRAYALLAVHEGPEPHAFLLGTSRASRAPEWPGNRLRQQLIDGVAADLAWQLSPSGQVVQRRVFPNAPPGSPRHLYTRAVRAEVSGDLERAYALALAAHQERPSARAARYLASIERHLAVRLHELDAPLASPSPPTP